MFVLKSNNVHQQPLVDQVIAAAVPESSEPQKASVAVKAFLDVDLPAKLIELLEKRILEPSPFNDNGSLQNLLMLTAAKADKGHLIDYIQRLSEFNAEEIANMCIDQEYIDLLLSLPRQSLQYKQCFHNQPICVPVCCAQQPAWVQIINLNTGRVESPNLSQIDLL